MTDKKPLAAQIFLNRYVEKLIRETLTPAQRSALMQKTAIKTQRVQEIQPQQYQIQQQVQRLQAPPQQIQAPPQQIQTRRIISPMPQRRPSLAPSLQQKPAVREAPPEAWVQKISPEMRPSMFTAKSKLPPVSQQSQIQEGFSLGSLTPILRDPSVLSVECPGPNKNILVNKSGRVQPASLKLSSDEIMSILNEFSEKTRIPVISGMFKAAYKNLIMTSVISEYVGTRFIIQKRNPFQRY